MSPLVYVIGAVLVFWVLACAWCGYHRRFVGFLTVLLSGMTLNTIWMTLGLQANLFDPYALMAHAAMMLYGISGVGFGMLAGRVVRQWRASAVDDATV